VTERGRWGMRENGPIKRKTNKKRRVGIMNVILLLYPLDNDFAPPPFTLKIKLIKLKEKPGNPKEPHIAFQGSALVGHEIIYLPPKSR
jgi:hypothetical protein